MIRLSIVLTLLSLAFIAGVVIVKPAFISQSSLAQRTFKVPDDDLDVFVGKVKSIKVEIEEHEFTTDFIDLANRYKQMLFQTSTFDREGKKTEKVNYSTDGKPLPKTTYSYDNKGVLLEESSYSAVSGKPYLETIYVYDSTGRLKEENSKNIEDNEFLGKRLYSYDEKKNYVEVAEYNWKNTLSWKVGFVFDNLGRVSEIVSFSKGGDILGKGTAVYDEKGNVIETAFTPSDSSSVKKEKLTYEFDEHSNWVKKTRYDWVTEEGKSFYKLMNITYRTITYY